MYEPIDPITARNHLTGLFARRDKPSPEVEAAARAKLATAKIDKAIHEAIEACPVPLHPAQVAYLVGRIEECGSEQDGEK